tara:strand:+ start:117 stop:905 length:789 start_codon:yes stop_codon:yes gene_type:complete
MRTIGRGAEPRITTSPGRINETLFYFFYDNNLLEELSTYVEAGAADGLDQSNTALLAESGWSGLLVDPLKGHAEACVVNRPESVVVRAALVSRTFAETSDSSVIEVQEPSLSLCTFVGTKPDFHEDDLSVVKKSTAPAYTLEFLLSKHNIEKVDFFSLDVEGYEFEVLDGLNLEINKPTFMAIECRQETKLKEYLAAHGYELIAPLSHHDYLFGLREYRQPYTRWKLRSLPELPLAPEAVADLAASLDPNAALKFLSSWKTT